MMEPIAIRIYCQRPLKVLSRMMDLAKSGLIRNFLIKGKARRLSVNFALLSSYESPLKILRHLVQLLTIRISQGGERADFS